MEMFNYYLSTYTNEIIFGLLIAMILVLIVLIAMIGSNIRWKKKYYRFMNNKNEFNLEDVLLENIKSINELRGLHIDTIKEMKTIENYVKLSYQKMGIVRYDAFQEMGGKLSFVISLLNQNDSGILLNGIHSREGCYIYLKTVESGKTDKTLSDEERKALQLAIKQN